MLVTYCVVTPILLVALTFAAAFYTIEHTEFEIVSPKGFSIIAKTVLRVLICPNCLMAVVLSLPIIGGFLKWITSRLYNKSNRRQSDGV